MRIQPVSALRGEIELPGDKSISHRYAILGAMARGITRIRNFSDNHDCTSTLDCLSELGVGIVKGKSELQIQSEGWENFRLPPTILNAGNSGTTIRLLTALLSGSPFASTIEGDESLNRRPMERIIVPLTKMGATFREGDHPPLHIEGAQLRGINYQIPVASAQVKSCLLLAGLMAQGETVLEERIPTRDHTERAIPFFTTAFKGEKDRLRVKGPASLKPTQMEIPGDFSAAAFFISAALLIPDSEIRLRKVGVNPTRTTLLELIEQSGGLVERSRHRNFNAEPVCDLRVRFSQEVLQRFPREIGGELIPKLIDEIPTLAVLGIRLPHGLAVRDAQELRKKESDRIHSIVANLRRLGLRIEEFPDGFYLPPGQEIRGGQIKTFGDHRTAMAFAIAGAAANEPVEIDDPSCVAVSFPSFFDKLQSISLLS